MRSDVTIVRYATTKGLKTALFISPPMMWPGPVIGRLDGDNWIPQSRESMWDFLRREQRPSHKYQNHDTRCSHIAEGIDYCWQFAHYVDRGREGDMLKVCKGCESWHKVKRKEVGDE